METKHSAAKKIHESPAPLRRRGVSLGPSEIASGVRFRQAGKVETGHPNRSTAFFHMSRYESLLETRSSVRTLPPPRFRRSRCAFSPRLDGWRKKRMVLTACFVSYGATSQTKEECALRTSCYEFKSRWRDDMIRSEIDGSGRIMGRSQASKVKSVLNQGQMYHSTFVNEEGIAKACGCPLLPLKSHIKGPALVSDQDTNDVIDEAIMFFRANIFFRNFNIQSSADKLLIYLTLYINIALKRLKGCRTLAEGTKAIINLGLEKVPVPGEPDFPLGSLFSLPQSKQEAELFRNYLRQLREETSGRLLSRAYRPNGTPNKWWLAFAKRKFISIVHHSTSS